MNLSTLAHSQLKATAAKYALQVDGDKRLRSTWENAIKSTDEFIAAKVDGIKDAAIVGRPALELKGKVFGHLTVGDRTGINKWGCVLWNCVCDCEKEVVTEGYRLTRTKEPMTHCGCLTSQHSSNGQKGNTNGATHGFCGTTEYNREKNYRRRVQLKTSSDNRPGYRGICKAVKEKHNFCVYCGTSGISAISDKLTIDHIFPICKGGTNDPKNLVTACRGCNLSKGPKLFIDWYNSYKGDLNTLEEILGYMGFEDLEHLTNYYGISPFPIVTIPCQVS